MDLVDPRMEAYLRQNQGVDDAVLAEMGRVGVERQFPIIGPLVGRLCEQLARSIGAKSVFEMGSGFGYSTMWFARAVGPKGRVVHTELDPAKQKEASDWLTKAGLAKPVEFRTGNAIDLLRKDAGPYDVIFIDIDKEGYPDAWMLACERVRVGGLILTDNVLWHGKVLERGGDEATRGVKAYTKAALADARFLTTILPLRDGVAISLRLR
jgi:predicted O-methyltransferase YrrM